jgi:hypothetical protein
VEEEGRWKIEDEGPASYPRDAELSLPAPRQASVR